MFRKKLVEFTGKDVLKLLFAIYVLRGVDRALAKKLHEDATPKVDAWLDKHKKTD